MSPISEEINSRKEIEDILKQTEVCRLGLQDGGMPYIIPMNFGFKDNNLYFHSAAKGHKIDLLKKDSRISFQCESEASRIKDEESGKWRMSTHSVMAEGRASFIESLEEKRAAMQLIMSVTAAELNLNTAMKPWRLWPLSGYPSIRSGAERSCAKL